MHFFRSRTGLFAVGGLILLTVLVAAGAVMLTGAPEPTANPRSLADAISDGVTEPLTDAIPDGLAEPVPLADAGRGLSAERHPADEPHGWPAGCRSWCRSRTTRSRARRPG